ncbi:hypothetical protein [Sinomonas sp. G460-2]|uniref:hypothetical protein n=1 Tax=Sinomonas sp. G460-2 TaxID=3393464 RepID=UPI0039EE3461
MSATTITDITTFDPATETVRRAWKVRRGQTIARIAKMSGEAEAKEFEAMIKKTPDRMVPWVSKSGLTVVVFTKTTADDWA